MARIAIVDDDLAMDVLAEALHFRGHDVIRILSADDALARTAELAGSDVVILDIIMAWRSGDSATRSGERSAGMEVLRAIRATGSTVPVIAYSATTDSNLISVIDADPKSRFVSKWDSPPLKDLVAQIGRAVGAENAGARLKSFIVHGQDEKTKLALKNYLQNTLGLPEPIVLHEQPNLGRTIVEKFEAYAELSSLVFVLLTPDDLGASAGDPNEVKRRARQNVIFEMGYFLGSLGRSSGRVVLLHCGALELPSDLSGVIYIDISNGIDAVGEQIRKEIGSVEL